MNRCLANVDVERHNLRVLVERSYRLFVGQRLKDDYNINGSAGGVIELMTHIILALTLVDAMFVVGDSQRLLLPLYDAAAIFRRLCLTSETSVLAATVYAGIHLQQPNSSGYCYDIGALNRLGVLQCLIFACLEIGVTTANLDNTRYYNIGLRLVTEGIRFAMSASREDGSDLTLKSAPARFVSMGALLTRRLHRVEEAGQMMMTAVALYEKVSEDSKDTTYAEMLLQAVSCIPRISPDVALAYVDEAMSIFTRLLGSRSLVYAQMTHEAADTLFQLGMDAEAEKRLLTAIDILYEVSPTSLSLMRAFCLLGRIEILLAKYSKALQTLSVAEMMYNTLNARHNLRGSRESPRLILADLRQWLAAHPEATTTQQK